MPIFDIHCPECGYRGKVLVLSADSPFNCPACEALHPEKLMSPTSTLTGGASRRMPGPKDHGCCGSQPAEAGSCCGRMHD